MTIAQNLNDSDLQYGWHSDYEEWPIPCPHCQHPFDVDLNDIKTISLENGDIEYSTSCPHCKEAISVLFGIQKFIKLEPKE